METHFAGGKDSLEQEKIDETTARLEAIRNELQFKVVVSLKSKVDTIALCNEQSLQSFDDQTRTIIEAILDNNSDLYALIEGQVERFSRQNAGIEALAKERHQETLSAIQNLSGRFD